MMGRSAILIAALALCVRQRRWPKRQEKGVICRAIFDLRAGAIFF